MRKTTKASVLLAAAAALSAPAFAAGSKSSAAHYAGVAFVGLPPMSTNAGQMSLRTGMRSMSTTPVSMSADLEAMVQEKIKSNKAMMFCKTQCPFCVKAKKAMDDLGITVEVMNLDNMEEGPAIQDIMLKMTGGRSVPRVFINGQFIGGGDDTVAKAASGELIKLYNA